MDNNTKFFVNENTSEVVTRVLTRLYNTKERVRVWYGDQDTGESWNEEFDITGTISRSTGVKPCLLLINNSRSMGGSSILTDKIIRIDTIADKRTCYIHPKFKVNLCISEENPCEVLDQLGVRVMARFSSPEKAKRWLGFMNGTRYSK